MKDHKLDLTYYKPYIKQIIYFNTGLRKTCTSAPAFKCYVLRHLRFPLRCDRASHKAQRWSFINVLVKTINLHSNVKVWLPGLGEVVSIFGAVA